MFIVEDLLYLLIAALISLWYKPLSKQPELQTESIQNNFVDTSENRTGDIIKNRILWIYNSESINKREKIVSLLVQLEKIEDTDIFFEKYEYVREYIFDST